MTGKTLDQQNSKRYEELDALRGLAAMLVVFFHITMGQSYYSSYFKYGTTGVDLFFVISGFVIFMSIQNITRGVHFVINRVSRLYPTYWTAVTFTFVIYVAFSIYHGDENYGKYFIEYLGNITMFQYYLKIRDLDGPYWTMIIEMLFYISILLLFQTKLLKYLNVVFIVLCISIVALTQSSFKESYYENIIHWFPLIQFLPLFFAGITFYKIHIKKENLCFHYSIVILCFICQIALFPYAGRSSNYINITEYSMMLLIYFVLITLFVNNSLSFIVNTTTLFLGKISYALYLIHQYPSLNFIIPIFYNKMGLNFWLVVFFINLPVVIGIAAFITYKIEIPYSKKMKEKLYRLKV